MNKNKNLKLIANQKSETAIIFLCFGSNHNRWRYCAGSNNSKQSETFKTKEEAIKSAFKNGFGSIKIEGKTIKKL